MCRGGTEQCAAALVVAGVACLTELYTNPVLLATSATGFAAMAVANLDQASPRLVARTFKLVAASHPSPG